MHSPHTAQLPPVQPSMLWNPRQTHCLRIASHPPQAPPSPMPSAFCFPWWLSLF